MQNCVCYSHRCCDCWHLVLHIGGAQLGKNEIVKVGLTKIEVGFVGASSLLVSRYNLIFLVITTHTGK